MSQEETGQQGAKTWLEQEPTKGVINVLDHGLPQVRPSRNPTSVAHANQLTHTFITT